MFAPFVKRWRYAIMVCTALLVAGTAVLFTVNSHDGNGNSAQDASSRATIVQTLKAKMQSAGALGYGVVQTAAPWATVSLKAAVSAAAHAKASAGGKKSQGKPTASPGKTPDASPSGTSSSSSSPSADPSGQPTASPTSSLPGWKEVFYDNFQNESVPLGQFSGCTLSPFTCSNLPSAMKSEWWAYPDGWLDTTQVCTYEPSQTLSVSGGIMNMFIHTASDGTCMTAVPEPILPDPVDSSNGQLYGMYSVRMESDPVPGYKTAFALWPDSENWPGDGEIDFPEGELDGDSWAYMHYQGATSGSQQDAYDTGTTYTGWHTYTIEWTPSYVKFLIDGNVIGDSTNASLIPDTPMHWIMQTESDLDGDKPASSAQGNLQIAWVEIWSYAPGSNLSLDADAERGRGLRRRAQPAACCSGHPSGRATGRR
jgi:hypothetical protein